MPVGVDAVVSQVNERLAVGGLSITREDALMLAQRRLETLAEIERVEFGVPAIVAVAEAVADSPCIAQGNVVDSLAKLQDAFYAARDGLSVSVSDAQVAQALRCCLDEWGDAADVGSMLPGEVLAYCDECVREQEQARSEYVMVLASSREIPQSPWTEIPLSSRGVCAPIRKSAGQRLDPHLSAQSPQGESGISPWVLFWLADGRSSQLCMRIPVGTACANRRCGFPKCVAIRVARAGGRRDQRRTSCDVG